MAPTSPPRVERLNMTEATIVHRRSATNGRSFFGVSGIAVGYSFTGMAWLWAHQRVVLAAIGCRLPRSDDEFL